jgi:hypothetical protein
MTDKREWKMWAVMIESISEIPMYVGYKEECLNYKKDWEYYNKKERKCKVIPVKVIPCKR